MRLQTTDPRELRVLHIGGYWRGPNDIVRQMMLGLRGAGAEVVEYDTDQHRDALDTEGRQYDRGTTGPVWLRWECLRRVVDEAKPDLIVCNAGGLSFRPDRSAALRRERTLLGIALSDPDVFQATTRHIAANFDRFLTNASAQLAEYRAMAVPVSLLPVATNEAFFHPVPPRPELTCDVLVVGRAHADRIDPVRALKARFRTHVYGEGWADHGIGSRGLVFGEEMLAALASATVTMVFDRTGAGHAIVKVGLFDFLAAGALVLTNRSPFVDELFAVDRELCTFGSTAELIERVQWFVNHPEDARRVRAAGRARVLADYTWRTAWPKVLRQMAAGTEGD